MLGYCFECQKNISHSAKICMRCSSTDPHGKKYVKKLKKEILKRLGLKEKHLEDYRDEDPDQHFWRKIANASRPIIIAKIRDCFPPSILEDVLAFSPLANKSPFLRKCRAYSELHNRAILELHVAKEHWIGPSVFIMAQVMNESYFLYPTNKRPFYLNNEPKGYVYPMKGLLVSSSEGIVICR